MLPLLLAVAIAADGADAAAARLLARAWRDEPGLATLQAAAADLAAPGEGDARRRARLAALVPRLSTGLRVDQRSYRTVGLTGASEVDYVRDSPGTVLEVRLAWDLDRLVHAREETAIAGDARAAARARTEAAAKVTRLWFDLRRARLAIAAQPAPEAAERAEQELRVEELAAEIDALTGGALTRGAR